MAKETIGRGWASGGSKTILWVVATAVVLIIGILGWKRWGGSQDQRDAGEQAGQDGGSSGRAVDRPELSRPDLATEAKATITGTVRTKGGGPIAGAQVCAWGKASQLRGLADGKPICTKTERDGHYRLEGLWPVETEVSASAAEHVPQQWRHKDARGRWSEEVNLRAGQVSEGIDIELEPGGARVRGVVKDIAGGEIDGALVVAGPGMQWSFTSGARAVARADAEGRFELWTKPGRIELKASAEGYAPGVVAATSPSESAEIFLTPESVLVGRVVHAQTGEGVPDLQVTASVYRNAEAVSVRSDAEGNFRIGGLQPGTYKPSASSDTFFGEAPVQVHLGLGQTSEPIEIPVHPFAALEGRVAIAGSDEGCPDATVSLMQGTDRAASGHADAEGSVVLRHVLPGEYEVVVRCPGMISEGSYPELVVTNESQTGLVWEVREGLAIRGVVVDPQGKGVGGISVSASAVVDASNARAQTTNAWAGFSEGDGSFELSGLLPGRYDIRVFGEGRPVPDEPLTVELDAGADRNDVRIELPASGTVKGRVIDEAGVGQRDVIVNASQLGKGRGGFGGAPTDDEGRFTLENVALGEVRVVASRAGKQLRKPGTTDDDVQGELVTIAANEVVEVELVVERSDGVITGKVLDEGGAPVDDAFVTAQRASDSQNASVSQARSRLRWAFNQQPMLTEADGSFTLENLGPGTYVVFAYRKGGGEALAENVELGANVELTIAPTGRLAGVVEVQGGDPPERFTLTARDGSQGLTVADTFFRTGGRWELSELPAGKFELTVTSTAGTATLEVELEEGGVREDLELILQPRVTVRGRVIDIDSGEPIPGMVVRVTAGGTFMLGGANAPDSKEVSDVEGRFEVASAPSGLVGVSVTPRNLGGSNEYDFLTMTMTIAPEPSEQDLGDLAMVKRRLEPREAAGDIGFELAPRDPAASPEQEQLVVGLIRPGGPADGVGLAIGDVIETVDGKPVSGATRSRFSALTRVPPGTVLELGLAKRSKVSITVGPPIE